MPQRVSLDHDQSPGPGSSSSHESDHQGSANRRQGFVNHKEPPGVVFRLIFDSEAIRFGSVSVIKDVNGCADQVLGQGPIDFRDSLLF